MLACILAPQGPAAPFTARMLASSCSGALEQSHLAQAAPQMKVGVLG